MDKIILNIILLTTIIPICKAQSAVTIDGFIISQHNNPISGALVYPKSMPSNGTFTDDNGKFTLSTHESHIILVCYCIGYTTTEIRINASTDRNIRICMKENIHILEEVEVTSRNEAERLNNPQIGVETINLSDVSKMPTFLGERDIIKTLQFLPGVKSDGDGSGGFQVRGGTSSQNHILMDEATIYNTGHLMGLFSTFNDVALSNATLYKGQIPAQYGGGVSSILNINTRSGNMESLHADISVGLLAANISIEGPIVKNKLSFFISARRTYFDLFFKLTNNYKNTSLNFYDLNCKLNYNINSNNRLIFSIFSSKDNIGMENMMEMDWGNKTTALRWFHRYSPNLYSNTSAFYSNYLSHNSLNILEKDRSLNEHIKHVGLKHSFIHSVRSTLELQYGIHTLYTDLKSADWNINNYPEKEQRRSWENSAWLNVEWKMTNIINISAGLRISSFSALGGAPYYKMDANKNIIDTLAYGLGDFIKTYFIAEPRFSMNWKTGAHQSLKIGYSSTSQHIHALRSGKMSLPFDRYTMSSNLIKPQRGHQVSLGYVLLTPTHSYEFSVEGYYKSIRNVLDYMDGKTFNSEIEIEKIVLAGNGRAYGLEVLIRKNKERLTGWLSYTLSWSENKIRGINIGQWYTASNDRRHNLSVVGMYRLSPKWSFSATWNYTSGQALTAPSAKYELNGETIYYYSERNGYRAPAYHRMDVSATYQIKNKHSTSEWVFGFYNLYNQYNPFIISFDNDSNSPTGTKTTQYSLFGIVPSVSYKIKF